MAEERRQNELNRKINKLHHSRQLYETLQTKNYEQYERILIHKKNIFNYLFSRQMSDLQTRRMQLLNEINRKDRRTKHFVKDKQETANLV